MGYTLKSNQIKIEICPVRGGSHLSSPCTHGDRQDVFVPQRARAYRGDAMPPMSGADGAAMSPGEGWGDGVHSGTVGGFPASVLLSDDFDAQEFVARARRGTPLDDLLQDLQRCRSPPRTPQPSQPPLSDPGAAEGSALLARICFLLSLRRLRAGSCGLLQAPANPCRNAQAPPTAARVAGRHHQP